ncbi:protein RALF-like 22 [Magnolia sinica]|uniref:protein RALF-like 22 n=1 Tax=Magnolia sinica TaxID=86752 RepID=UPI00265B0016|nr:protein RALF-like 22 [Magnolia sinica]
MMLGFCMGQRVALLLCLLAMAHVAESSAWDSEAQLGPTHTTSMAGDGHGTQRKACNDLVGDCIDEEEERAMESDISRRSLAGTAKRYISYSALKKNQVPCNRRGSSYYNCRRSGRVNPYRRACTVITRCKRDLR